MSINILLAGAGGYLKQPKNYGIGTPDRKVRRSTTSDIDSSCYA